MISNTDLIGPAGERVAVKDENLVYRACSLGYAQSFGQSSPDDIVGRTDFDLLPGHVARAQMALDSRTVYSGLSDIGTIELPAANASLLALDSADLAMIVRTPVFSEDKDVTGIDIRLLGGSQARAMSSAVAIDYRTLVTEGIQGSLIMARQSILFADENAAAVLGYDSAQSLIHGGRVAALFTESEVQRIAAEAAKDLDGNDRTGRRRITLIGANPR